MCGIAGAIGPNSVAQHRVQETLSLMRNRGPNGSGSRNLMLGEFHVVLLHSRLAIIDLDPRSDQPYAADGYTLVFNGEIYNYLELRADLELLGHDFRTSSDTEVVLRAYQQYGEDCFDRFEGMWALALHDQRKQTLVLSRDRFGEKPLYYANWDSTLYFGSEVKFIAQLAGRLPTVNARQIRRYLVNGYKSLHKQAETFFTDVTELPTASVVRLNAPDMPAPKRYWKLAYQPQHMTMAQALEGVRERLFRAVELRLRSDVPLAFCLSGGVDSTGLAAIAARHFGHDLHAFSVIDRDERYDESENLALTVRDLGCQHDVARTTNEGFFERLSRLVAYHDSPVATISYYVHSFLSEAISAAGYKVAVSGTGADELFTGYYDHYGFWLAEMHDRRDFASMLEDWRSSYGAFVRNPLLQDPLAFHKNPKQRAHIYLNRDVFNGFLIDPIDEDFEETEYSANLLQNRKLNELFHESVPVLLHEDDLNSMHWSVENRSPYLDRSLSEFLYTVPNEHLIHDGYVKWLLRTAVGDLAPAKVMQDKRKRGFNASIESLVDRNDPKTVEQLLSPSPIFEIVRRESIERLIGSQMTDNSFSKFLFSFVSAKLFLESDLTSGGQLGRRAA